MTDQPATPFGPVRESARILGLDVVRGAAIFGIFVVNIAFFAAPLAALFDPTAGASQPVRDQVVHLAVRALFEFKFVSLFSLLFGAGMMLQWTRAEAAGRRFVPMYMRRTLLLGAIGLAHALLLWYGDILFMYALTALAVMWLRRESVRTLVLLGAIFVLVSAGLIMLNAVVAYLVGVYAPTAEELQVSTAVETVPVAVDAGTAPTDGAAGSNWDRVRRAVEAAFEEQDLDRVSEAETIAYREGPFAVAFVVRAATFGVMFLFTLFSGFLFRVAGAFMIGAALMKIGFFAAERRAWHRKVAVIGLAVGLPLELGLAVAWPLERYEYGVLTMIAEALHPLSSAALAAGYLGVLLLLADAGRPRWLASSLAAVGRTALSNYLLQTIVATAVMYWWGLGRFGTFDRVEQITFVVSVFAVQLALSPLWLRGFTMGPVEWAWRRLTYGTGPPLRRRAPDPGDRP